MNTRGSIENSAILGMAVVTALTYSALVGAGILREQLRIEALVAEAHRIKEAVQNWQADNADPVTGYTNAEEVGWPDAFGPDGFLNDPVGPPPTPSTDDCSRALAALAGDVDFDGIPNAGEPQYLPAQHAYTVRSQADPRLHWVTQCLEPSGQRFILQLSSFGPDPACSVTPGDLAQECPGVDIAQIVAHATGGRVLVETTGSPSPFATTNSYVQWPLWRGAAYPIVNELYEQLLAKNYNDAIRFGISNPTAAFSGIQFGPWPDLERIPLTAGHPANLARWISGIDSADPDNQPPPLAPTSPTRLDARSFVVFNRAVEYDPFNGLEDLFTVPVPSPCGGVFPGVLPRWIATVESMQMTFSGFDNTDAAVVTVRPFPLPPGERVALMTTTGWQVHDDGGSNIYSPEIQFGVFVILPSFLDTFSPLGMPPLPQTATDRGLCQPAVMHGNIDSGDPSAQLGVFRMPPFPGAPKPWPPAEAERRCIQSNGTTSYTVRQSIPDIPRAQLAVRGAPGSAPAVQLSVMAHCPAIASGADR